MTDNDAPAAGLVEALRKELRDARRIISATHKNPVVHTNCEVHNCPICDGGLFQCADCGAAEIETETRVCSAALQAPQEAGVEPDAWLFRNVGQSRWLVSCGDEPKASSTCEVVPLYRRSALSQPVATPAPSQDAAVKARVTVPAGQTPLNDKLGHMYLDVFNEGVAARDSGKPSPYHGHSLEHCLHAAGWVQRDLRLALDAAKAAATRPAEAQAVAEWAVDREMIARAAADPNLSDASVRLLCIAKTGEVTDEVQAWADSVIAASPATGGA